MKPRFRILHCLRAPVGGLFRHVCDLAAEQIARGHEVGLVCDAGGNALTETRLAVLAPRLAGGLHRLDMRREIGVADWLALRRVSRVAQDGTFDILHGHGAKGGAFARLAAWPMRRRGAGITALYTPHGGSLHYDRHTPKGAVFMAVERRLGTLTDGIVFESAYSAARYETQVGRPAAASRIIPNGLLPDEFAPRALVAAPADVLFVGELRHLKGVDILLNALGRLSRNRPVRAVIVGDGPDAETFRRQARQLGLADRVVFPGAMPARTAFGLGRILVMPSRAESFPYIVLEAAAAGIPLLATRVGGIPEIVEGTDTPLLPAQDIGALAAALEAALRNPEALQARAERLRTHIRDRFTVGHMTDEVLGFYAERVAAAVRDPQPAGADGRGRPATQT